MLYLYVSVRYDQAIQMKVYVHVATVMSPVGVVALSPSNLIEHEVLNHHS